MIPDRTLHLMLALLLMLGLIGCAGTKITPKAIPMPTGERVTQESGRLGESVTAISSSVRRAATRARAVSTDAALLSALSEAERDTATLAERNGALLLAIDANNQDWNAYSVQVEADRKIAWEKVDELQARNDKLRADSKHRTPLLFLACLLGGVGYGTATIYGNPLAIGAVPQGAIGTIGMALIIGLLAALWGVFGGIFSGIGNLFRWLF